MPIPEEAWGVLFSYNDPDEKLFLTDQTETFHMQENGEIIKSNTTRLLNWRNFVDDDLICKFKKYEDHNEPDIRITVSSRQADGIYINGKRGRETQVVENGRCNVYVANRDLHLVFEALCNVSEDERLRGIGNNYRYISLLGKGHFAEVYKAIMVDMERFCAIKVERKTEKMILKGECNLLRHLKHENVIKCLDFIDTGLQQYIVFELASGGSLRQKIIHGDEMDESIARFIFRQIFSAVEYIHDKGVMHRDIKPDNIVFMSSDNYSVPKLIDFGLSAVDGGNMMKRAVVGSLRFFAPELLYKYTLPAETTDRRVAYSNKIDVWSLGLCLFNTLTNDMPFTYSRDLPKYLMRIKENKLNTSSEGYKDLTSLAKNLIFSCLVFDDNNRPTVTELLEHEWFQLE